METEENTQTSEPTTKKITVIHISDKTLLLTALLAFGLSLLARNMLANLKK